MYSIISDTFLVPIVANVTYKLITDRIDDITVHDRVRIKGVVVDSALTGALIGLGFGALIALDDDDTKDLWLVQLASLLLLLFYSFELNSFISLYLI